MLLLMIAAVFLLPYAIGNRIYAGGNSDGLYVSDDDGRNWKYTQPPTYDPKAIFVTEDKIYIGFDKKAKPGVYVSADDGQSWKQLKNISVNSIFVLSDHLYVGSPDGLYISIDGGESWIRKTTADGLGFNNVVSVYLAAGMIYAGTDIAGLSISADGGKTWTIKQTAQGLANARVKSVFAIGDNVLVATWRGISISRDRGQTWVTKNEETGLKCYSKDFTYSATMSTQNTIYVTFDISSVSNCLGISRDGGNTWAYKTNDDGLGAAGTSLFVLDGEIYLGDYKHLSISRDDGKTWVTQAITSSGYGVSSIFVVPDKETSKLNP